MHDESAIRLGRSDVTNGSRVLQYFAITAAWAGEKELALQQLEAGLRALPTHRSC